MSYLARTRQTAADALRLREWALKRLLFGADAEVPLVSSDVWRTVLHRERCALILQESFEQRGANLNSDTRGELRSRAMKEAQWILSARGHLRMIERLATGNGIPVLVLKGTADVAQGRSVQITDVDVLTAPADAPRLVALLDSEGFTRDHRDATHHLAPRGIEGAVKIEVHVAVSGFDTPSDVPWGDVRPVPGMEALLMLAPHDHAWTVLCQASRKHPDRRARIRDLYLLQEALTRCTVAERARLNERVMKDPYRADLLEMLEQASNPLHESRSTEETLRRLYLLYAREWKNQTHKMTGVLWRAVVDSVAAGSAQDWERRQRLRVYSGLPRWSLNRLFISAPLAVASALIGRVMSCDQFLIEP